ncbi:MAG: MlaE family lipid ABC transporter permease subunit [Deltaproteobacteria bacterium]|nr:MlaE family lipid ABC transporter permease subunit [Deltaproteobacteria bacterium]
MTQALEGKLTRDTVPAARTLLAALERETGPVALDLSRVTEADSAGVALLSLFARTIRASGRQLQLVNVPPALAKTLALFPFPTGTEAMEAPRVGLLERWGDLALLGRALALEYLVLCADAVWFAIGGLFTRRGTRWAVVSYEMSAMGSKALGVVGLIAFLVGGTMALQSAAQLRQFGANIFVVDLIGISMTRELGPLMAAIVVAGRSGSAVAAEIGTMVVTEEIDALKTMGLHPTRFLVVPKLLAISLTQPLVTILADVFGIFGGFLVAITYLDVGPDSFLNRLETSLMAKDILTGLIKSVMFAQLIVTIGALCGYRTQGGADAVGRSTTTAVVASIFAVITADALASLVFYF